MSFSPGPRDTQTQLRALCRCPFSPPARRQPRSLGCLGIPCCLPRTWGAGSGSHRDGALEMGHPTELGGQPRVSGKVGAFRGVREGWGGEGNPVTMGAPPGVHPGWRSGSGWGRDGWSRLAAEGAGLGGGLDAETGKPAGAGVRMSQGEGTQAEPRHQGRAGGTGVMQGALGGSQRTGMGQWA